MHALDAVALLLIWLGAVIVSNGISWMNHSEARRTSAGPSMVEPSGGFGYDALATTALGSPSFAAAGALRARRVY